MASSTGAKNGKAYDEFISTTGDELWDRLHHAHHRFAALLSMTPSRTRIPGSDWTARDVAGHLLTVLRRYTRRDLSSPEGLSADVDAIAVMNADALEALELIGVAEILDQVWQELAELEAKLPRTADLHQKFPFHSGQQLDVAGWLGNLTGEFLLHGRDVARARGKTWKLGSRNAALVLNVAMQVSPGYVVPGARDLKLGLRTSESNPWILDLVDGKVTSRPAGRREPVDVLLRSPTQPLLLNMYGRIGFARTATLGTTVIGGRKPWRIVRLPGAFDSP